MPKFIVRKTSESSIEVDAVDVNDAMDKATNTNKDSWTKCIPTWSVERKDVAPFVGAKVKTKRAILPGGQNWSDNTLPENSIGEVVEILGFLFDNRGAKVDFGAFGVWDVENDEFEVIE